MTMKLSDGIKLFAESLKAWPCHECEDYKGRPTSYERCPSCARSPMMRCQDMKHVLRRISDERHRDTKTQG